MTPRRNAPWSDFVRDAPALAAATAEVLSSHPHHVIATTRGDGSPRVGGTNVFITDGIAWIGMMPVAARVRDLRRDPRCAIHSAPLEQDLARGDIRLDLVATEAGPDLAARLLSATGSPGSGVVFTLEVSRASLVRVEDDHLVIETWLPGRSATVTTLKG